ncbi:hypothetical protein OGH69_04470 [Flavobacterium sp. MFBS3-15]|uniref:hypothetical protein n=1 Tax=Flavobacterium sp. MFBS3-15 TaxID=2989816 RepID=UPI0022361920|nr:hypothetical protein [Flavobacterium sp. MFBS3-15]MCW4468212.1 hypothetical protein [Flavobacterium sp. MFBS3-15]
MGRKAYRIFLVLDILLLAGILYFLYFGFYHWTTATTWSGPPDHSLTIRGDFLSMVYLAAIMPVILAVISKRFLWLIQTVIIVVVGFYWQTDILQQTLFRNQVCSTAKESDIAESFMLENEPLIVNKVMQINELMKDSLGKTNGYKFVSENYKFISESHALEPYHEAVGLKGKSYSIFAIEFYNNKVKKIFLRIDFKGVAYHTSELTYYPENFEEWEPLSNSKFPLGTNLMVTCSRQYYYFGKKWLLYFEGRCFG